MKVYDKKWAKKNFFFQSVWLYKYSPHGDSHGLSSIVFYRFKIMKPCLYYLPTFLAEKVFLMFLVGEQVWNWVSFLYPKASQLSLWWWQVDLIEDHSYLLLVIDEMLPSLVYLPLKFLQMKESMLYIHTYGNISIWIGKSTEHIPEIISPF